MQPVLRIMAQPMSRIIVQCDWDHVLRQKGGKAWIAFREQGKKSEYGEMRSNGMKNNEEYEMTVTEGFTVDSACTRHLTLSYCNDGQKIYRCRFQAPDSVFSKTHNTRKNVLCMDVTPGGLGVSCDMEGKLKIWVTESGEVRRDLVGHYGDVYCCRFFPSGIVVLSGGADTQLKVWSAEDGQCAATLTGHKAGILDLAIVERGRNVVSVSRDGTAKLWDCGRSSCLATFDDVEGGVINGCHIGVPSSDYDLGHPDLPPGEREILTEGKLLLLACENKSLKAYGLHSRKKVFSIGCSGAVNCCTFLSDHLVICGTDDSHVNVIDTRNTSSFLASFHETRSAILSLQPYKEGCFISTGDGSCFFLDENLKCGLELTGSDCDPLYRVVTDGQSIYTCCRDGSIRRYHMQGVL